MGKLVRCISHDGTLTVMAVNSTDIVNKAISYHKTAPTATALLGRLLTGASIMGTMLPEDGCTLTEIGAHAFYFLNKIESLELPKTVTVIGNYAFYGCTSLTRITIPTGVTSIGDCAFNAFHSLTSITIPDSVTSIGSSAFERCKSLTNMEIPGSVTSIGKYAFYNCESLTGIDLPDSIRSIGVCAFNTCSKLEKIHLYDESKSNFLTWLTAFVKNTALNQAKKNAKHEDYEDIKEMEDSISANNPTPEQIVLQKEREEELLKALNTLKPQDKLIFYRKYYYMQSTEQIAVELGTTIRAIEGKLYRIKKQLRKSLGGDFYER